MEAFEWWRLLAHNHYLSFKLGSRRLRICARCSGTVLGAFSAASLISSTKISAFNSLPFPTILLVSILFILPASLDWLTQSWGLRESNNRLRVLTGIFEGAGVAALASSMLPPVWKITIVLCIGIGVVDLGLFGRNFLKRTKLSSYAQPNPASSISL